MSHRPFFRLAPLSFLILLTFGIASCIKDDIVPNNQGEARARIEMTDAPIDNPNVKGVFITVIDIKIDGKSWAGFDGKTTFDLLNYRNGTTKLLGEGTLEAGSHSEITLVLDTETDQNGTSPGCYIKDAQGNNTKIKGSNLLTIKSTGNIQTQNNATTNAVLDLDLRKSIVYQSGSTTTFQFVTEPELSEAIRLLDKSTTGTIKGDCTDGVSGSDKIIVFAYEKGDYNANEKFPQGSSQVTFKNAVTSALVEDDGNFQLSFLKSGNYELHFISYKTDAQGELQATGELQMNVVGGVLDLLQLNVAAKAEVRMDVVVTGILFF